MLIHNFEIKDVRCDKRKIFTFVNPYSYYLLSEQQVDKFDKVYADGVLLVLLYNLFNRRNKISRFSFDFTSLAPIIFRECVEQNYSVCVIGGNETEIEKASRVLTRKYQGLNLQLATSGYFTDMDAIIEQISEQKIDVIIAGLGTPLQEEFLIRSQEKVPSLRFAFTCGGFLTQISENENYFHPLMDRLNLRWLQRFVRHSYVRKRLLLDYPLFVIRFLWNNIKRALVG